MECTCFLISNCTISNMSTFSHPILVGRLHDHHAHLTTNVHATVPMQSTPRALIFIQHWLWGEESTPYVTWPHCLSHVVAGELHDHQVHVNTSVHAFVPPNSTNWTSSYYWNYWHPREDNVPHVDCSHPINQALGDRLHDQRVHLNTSVKAFIPPNSTYCAWSYWIYWFLVEEDVPPL
jgi:hypothetical protein